MNSYSANYKIPVNDDGQIEQLLMESLISRRSVHPRRLVAPGPDSLAVRQMIEVAVTAIDHGGLCPWRFISISGEAAVALGDLFVEIKLSRNKDISDEELLRERNRAQAVPVTIAVIDRSNSQHNVIPLKEQHASIGAAIQNLVLSAHLMGFGAKMVSGKKITHSMLGERLGLSAGESVFGFVCMGTSVPGTSCKPRPEIDDVLSVWNPRVKLGREKNALDGVEQARVWKHELV